MRRLKTCRQVIANLPDKMESVSFCPLGKKQIARYQKTVDNLASLAEAATAGQKRKPPPGPEMPGRRPGRKILRPSKIRNAPRAGKSRLCVNARG